MSVETTVAGWPFSVVHLAAEDGTQQTSRVAAMVFDTPDGFAFASPGYLDPFNCGHGFHRVVCKIVSESADEIAFTGPEWSGRIERYTGTRVQQSIGAHRSFEWYPVELAKQTGRTVDEERAHLRTVLADQLA